MALRLRLALLAGLVVVVTLVGFEALFYADMLLSPEHPAAAAFVVQRGWRMLLFGAAAAGAAAFLAAWLAGARVMRPLTSIVEAAARLAEGGDFSRRLPEGGSGDPEVERLTRTFNALVLRVDTLLGAQRQFLADTSHELRTPLTTVRGNLDLLMHGLPPEDRAEILAESLQEIDRMARLVRDLLLLAESGEVALPVLAPVRLDVLVREVAERVAAPAGAHRVVVQGDAVTVHGDEDRLRQLVGNLVENALRHASRQDGAVRVTVARQPPHALVTVADDGPGIPSDALGRVFDRFYRVDRARSRAQGGVGLGLAIVRHVAETHRGRVWAEHRPEGGARLCVLLPAEPSWVDTDATDQALPASRD